jgi:hypothetical protein
VTFEADRYVTLMASLPHIGLLSSREPPITRTRLVARLKALAPEDAAEIETVRALLDWEALGAGGDDAAYLDRAEGLIDALRSPILREAACDRLEIRTVVAALRRRRAGEDAPPAGARWGYGRHAAKIRANWSRPDFGLGRTYPWLAQAQAMIEAGETAALERLLLDAAWAAIDRRAAGHHFDLPAVAFYLMRWSLADRWSRYDADAAAARFAALLDAALAEGAARGEAA